jgi:hypothetical protein
VLVSSVAFAAVWLVLVLRLRAQGLGTVTEATAATRLS